ncbi:MAG: hypothetical protein MUF52_16215 [Syntrophobacteraceae bacterium]|jgi:hypothetical protein|nr:hypothetical protein [Syntrophobacteraceae bacterium]
MTADTTDKPSPSSVAERGAIIADLLLLAPHTEIVHHIPGRIRLRLGKSGLGVLARTDVETLLRHVPGIRSLRVNRLVGSLTLEYDESRLPHGLWERLAALRERPDLRGEVEEWLNDLWK